jgi:hypothetical protein
MWEIRKDWENASRSRQYGDFQEATFTSHICEFICNCKVHGSRHEIFIFKNIPVIKFNEIPVFDPFVDGQRR